MKKLLRIGGILVVLALLAGLAALLLLDSVARVAIQKRLQSQTGMKATIAHVNIGLRSPTLTVRGLRLMNPAEFGGGPFLKVEELHFEYDRELLRERKVRFKRVRFHLAELNMVEDHQGRTNLRQLGVEPPAQPAGRGQSSTNGIAFAGIEQLDVTLGRATFTSFRRPEKNWETELGLHNETFNAIENEEDLATVAIVLAIKGGVIFLLEKIWRAGK
jgi:uncharacterized protein YhdP